MSNLLEKLTLEDIKGIQVLGARPERRMLERDVPIEISATELNESQLGDTVVYENEELGQRITLQNLLSMFVFEGTSDVLIESHGKKVLPPEKGVRLKDLIMKRENNFLPKSFKVHDIPVYVGTNTEYLEAKDKGELRKHIYEQKGVLTDTEFFPMLVVRDSRIVATNPDNWKFAQRSLITPSW